jgi:TRAP-type C4-dicarboxylate transport system substrate-binding protein
MRKLSRLYATLASAAAVVIATAIATSTPTFAQKIIWQHNIFGPKRAVTAGMEAVRDYLEKASNGQLEIKISYGAALGPPKQIPEAIKSGGYDGGQMCAGYYPNKFPLLSVMELPFLTPAKTEDRAKVYEALMRNPLIVKELADRWNIKYVAPVFLPPYEFMGNKRIKSVADMKGVKMRISGLNAKALEVFGAVPTNVTAPEGYTALERGTIDSFGFPYSYAFGAYKLYEVSKYVTNGMGMGGFMCFQGVNLKTWNKLPANLRAKLPEALKAADAALLAAYKKADAKWIPLFKKKLEVDDFPASERAKLAAGASKIWEAWAKNHGPDGRKILDFVKAESAKYK